MAIKLPLNRGKVAIIDEADAEVVRGYRWGAVLISGVWYAQAHIDQNGRRTTVYMHRLIMGATRSHIVDHVNHDGLDNRRKNLRLCTKSQNMMNRRGPNRNSKSGFIGVSYLASRKKHWYAHIMVDGKTIRIGEYETAEEAARERDKVAVYRHGKFARLNFPHSGGR